MLCVITRSAPPTFFWYASIPLDTVLTASTSRPESVSSRIAILGLSIRSCKTSAFFFSPPENPQFKSLCKYFSSISRRAMFSSTSFLNSQNLILFPVFCSNAFLKNSLSVIPGTSTGAWNDKNTPSFALSLTASSVISLPSRTIEPLITLYLGLPMIVRPSVVLPAPLGPISTCVSPALRLRLIL